MPQLRLADLEKARDVGVIIGATFCGFYERDDDIEVAFAREDGNAILRLIRQFLSTQDGEETPNFLLHRFKNLDDVEVPDHLNSAFRIRKNALGVEFTVSNWLQPEDQPSDGEIGGMSICISREDARRAAEEFAAELDGNVPGAG